MKTDKKHYYLIDGLRGLAIINMVLFHFLYDVNVVYGNSPYWFRQPLIHIWQQCICFSFILIAGISFHFSRSNMKRGFLLNFYGIVITIVTLIFLPSEVIWFGILNFIGCAILLLALIQKPLQKLMPVAGIVISVFLFIFTYHIDDGYLGFFSYPLITIPDFIYQFRILTIFGLPFPGFSSSDYFPIFPWFFLFLCGYFFWSLLSDRKNILSFAEHKIPLLSTLGRYSIWIYLAHQPLSILICELLF